MPKLSINTQVSHSVDVFDLENFINQIYGIGYEIIANEEASNDSTLHYSVTPEIASWQDSTVQDFLNGNDPSYATGTILNMLCRDNHIPAGEYYITISW